MPAHNYPAFNQSQYDSGRSDGLAGAVPQSSDTDYMIGWRFGDACRRIASGECIGLVGSGTKCNSCGGVEYGHRFWCRCNKTLDDRTVCYGALVRTCDSVDNVAQFMTTEELKSSGKKLIDYFTGEPVELKS